jgi:hypothetical protein
MYDQWEEQAFYLIGDMSTLLAHHKEVKTVMKWTCKTRLKRAQKQLSRRRKPNKTGHFGIRKRPKKDSKLTSKRTLKIQ